MFFFVMPKLLHNKTNKHKRVTYATQLIRLLVFLFARPVHISRSGHGYLSFADGKRSVRNWDNRLGCEA